MPTSSSPPMFWEVHHRVGTVELSATDRVLVSVVCRAGHRYVRLCPERRTDRASGPQWTTAGHVLLLPPATLPVLEACLAETRVFLESSDQQPPDQSPSPDVGNLGVDTRQPCVEES